MPMTPLRTRESITWRIPIDLLEQVDEVRRTTGQNRTAVVVEALKRHVHYLRSRAKHSAEAEREMKEARRVARAIGRHP